MTDIPAGEGRVEEMVALIKAAEKEYLTNAGGDKWPSIYAAVADAFDARLRAVEEESRTFEARWLASVNESNTAQAEARRLRDVLEIIARADWTDGCPAIARAALTPPHAGPGGA